jgi:membrane protease YdiL (CAAX protease family)
MATLAGVAYGWVWLRTRRVTASAITHAGVDWIWLLVFRG